MPCRARVALAAGGTGGHLFAAVGMARALKRRGMDAVFLIPDEARSRRFLSMEPEAEGIPVEFYEWGRAGGRPGVVERMLALPAAFLRCRAILRRLRPEAVVAPGGYAAVPVGLAARHLGVSLAIHEENAVLGRANRLLAPFATRRLSAMPIKGRDDFDVVGLPLRERLLPLSAALSAGQAGVKPTEPDLSAALSAGQAGRPAVLVMGGSQGASALDEAMVSLYPFLAGHKSRPTVIHIAGPHAIENARRAFAREFKEAPDWAGVFEFRSDMQEVYARATLVVIRAGALTVAEISFLALPAVLVPYPHACYHQMENARALKRSAPADVRVVEQGGDFVERLRQALDDLLARVGGATDRGSTPAATQRIGNDGEALATAVEEILSGQ